MKKTLIALSFAAFVFTACGGSQTEENSDAQQEAEEMTDELMNEMEAETTTVDTTTVAPADTIMEEGTEESAM